MRRFATVLPALLAVALLAPAAAPARVVLVATGEGGVPRPDAEPNGFAPQTRGGGRPRAPAAAPDGSRGYVAAGVRVVAIDLTTRQPVGAATLAGAPSALAVSADGLRLYAARPGAIDVIDPATFSVLASIRLPRTSNPTSLAVSGDGTRAAAAIDRRHVAIVSLQRGVILKRVEVANPGAVAYAPGDDDVWVASPAAAGGRLVRFGPEGQFVARYRAGPGVGGGGLTFSPTGRRAVVGADSGQHVTVVFDVSRKRPLARVRTGDGPGFPAWSQDRTRIYVADRADGTVSVLSGLSFKRLTVQRLGGRTRPTAIAVQPGVANVVGTPGNDVVKGSRGLDRIDGQAGDDTLAGGRSNDVLLGGLGNDLLPGGPHDDLLDGGEGDDRLFGQSGKDQLIGEAGNDSEFGGNSNDKLDGGDGNDFLDGGDADDTLIGGAGDDEIIEAGPRNDILLDR